MTQAYRKVAGDTVHVMGKTTVAWNQRDLRGRLVSNGTYYFWMNENGQPMKRAVLVILR